MNPLLLLIILVFAILAVRWVLQASTKSASSASRSWLSWILLGTLLLAVTGRLGILVPIIGVLLAALVRLAPVLIAFLPVFQRLWRERQTQRTANSADGERSTAEAKYLRMELHHASGEIRGSVLRGRFAGRDLHSMTVEELVELHRECRGDDRNSTALLEAYLDRVHGDRWRQFSRSERSRPSGAVGMTMKEAYEILGLEPGASRDAIIQAHRRLMQKLHPDRGGSDYLAAEVNRAKEILLGN